MDINTLPKGHIIGWAPPPPTNTSTSGSTGLSKSAAKNAKRRERKRGDKKEGGDSEKPAKAEDVPDNWDDDESVPLGSNSGTPDTEPSMTTTDAKPAKENQQVSPGDDLSSKLEELKVK